jgi:hypothetical protein
MEEYCTQEPHWDVLVDLDALATTESEDWIWQGAHVRPGDDRAILRLSRGGSDAVVLREFDLTARALVLDGFTAPEAKGGIAWLDLDLLLLSSALGEDMATNSGYARTVRLWRRGQSPFDAPVIHEVPATFMAVSAELDRESEDERVVFVERITFIDTVYRLGDRHGAGEALDRPTDAWVAWQRGWVAVRTRTPWEVDGVTHVPDTVLGLRLAAFLAGDRRFTVLFTPGDRRTLQGFFWSDGKLVLSILDELAPVFEVLSPEGGWERTTLATLPKLGVVAVWPLDQEEIEQDGTLLINAQDPLTPPTLLRLGESLAQPTVLRQAPRAFSAPEAVVNATRLIRPTTRTSPLLSGATGRGAKRHRAAPGDPGDVIRKVKDCPHRIAVSFRRMAGSGPRPIIDRVAPEAPGLGLSPAGLEDGLGLDRPACGHRDQWASGSSRSGSSRSTSSNASASSSQASMAVRASMPALLYCQRSDRWSKASCRAWAMVSICLRRSAIAAL